MVLRYLSRNWKNILLVTGVCGILYYFGRQDGDCQGYKRGFTEGFERGARFSQENVKTLEDFFPDIDVEIQDLEKALEESKKQGTPKI